MPARPFVYLSDDDVRELLDVKQAITIAEQTLLAHARDQVDWCEPRQIMLRPAGSDTVYKQKACALRDINVAGNEAQWWQAYNARRNTNSNSNNNAVRRAGTESTQRQQLADYYVYPIEHTTTIADQQTKQLSFSYCDDKRLQCAAASTFPPVCTHGSSDNGTGAAGATETSGLGLPSTDFTALFSNSRVTTRMRSNVAGSLGVGSGCAFATACLAASS